MQLMGALTSSQRFVAFIALIAFIAWVSIALQGVCAAIVQSNFGDRLGATSSDRQARWRRPGATKIVWQADDHARCLAA
jgi:hypothetical protein